MLTGLINGNQIDFQTAIVYDGRTGWQTGYQHLYMVRNMPTGDDMKDKFANNEPVDPCLKNPCKNNAICAVGFGNNFACFCPDSFTGFRLIY